MAEITNLTADGRLAEDWQTINNNFENLNTDKAEASTTYTKTEVDNAVSGKVSKSGDTMSGDLQIEKILNSPLTGTTQSSVRILPSVPYSLIDSTHTTTVYLKELIKYICQKYPNDANVNYIGSTNPNSTGTCIIRIYTNKTVDSNGYPQYADGTYFALGGAFIRFGFQNYVWYYKEFPVDSKLTDTVTTVTTTGAGNAVTSVTASNGALTVTKGSTYLTSHQDISGKANLASPAFTGTPTAPTAAAATNSTQIATTAFVKAQGYLTGITKAQVTTALGYTPPTSDTNTWRPLCATKATTTSTASTNATAAVTTNYVNGANWYRKWSDGWVEQGGIVTTSVSNGTQQKITLLVTMANTNYCIIMNSKNVGTNLTYNSSATHDLLMPNSVTTSSFQHVARTDARLNTVVWYVCGYGA